MVDCEDSDFTINVGRVFTDTDKDGAVDSYDLESCTPELVASTKVVSRHTETMYGTRPGVKEIDDLPPLDCAKDNPSLKAGASFYLDADQDGLGAGKPTYLCGEILNGVMSEVTAPVGYSNHSGDCNDSNPDVQRDCKMEWKLDSYYGADQKPKRLVSHPDGNPTFGKDLNIQLSTYLEYDGDDKDQLIYEVECEVCKEETPSNGYFKGEVIANARGEFRSVAGKHTIHVRAKSEKYGDTAEGAIEIQVYTGDAIVYINGIDTQLQERILVTTDTDCSSGVLMDSFCERGATGALKRLKDLTEYPFVSSISPSSEYYDFSLAYNPSNGIAEDLIKECLPSSIADFDNSPEAEGFGKAIIEFVKFGTSNGLKAFAGATEKLQEALRKRIVESAKEDISHRLDYKSAERIVQNKIREGFRVTLVSHSQGNFISNNLYKNLEMEGKSEYIRQVQIAAPTNFSEDDKNRYVNGKKDIVTFISRGHRPTDLELDCTDPMEHNFIECYVGPDDSSERRSRTMILDYFQQALTELRLNGGN
ncbi:MAG: hypothetical protein EOP10_01585 [Proteobacteria bacterium]|nr:MAG: hypothetical protein EOP10_01585 [Pseudomonadota bacterium]